MFLIKFRNTFSFLETNRQTKCFRNKSLLVSGDLERAVSLLFSLFLPKLLVEVPR